MNITTPQWDIIFIIINYILHDIFLFLAPQNVEDKSA